MQTHGRGYRLLVLGLFGLALALAGGASRLDEDSQAVVRLASIAAIVASLWPLELDTLRRRPWLIAAAAAAYVLLILQLIPLPPGLWAGLPGRTVYAQIAQETGSAVWRPLSLTPDLTLNALFALLPATAAAIAALHLDFRGRVRLVEAVVVIACFSAILGLLQLSGSGLELYRNFRPGAASGLFANANHQADLLACALPLASFAAGLRLSEGGDPRPVLASLAGVTALLLLGLISTGSRMGLALGLFGLAGAAWCWRSNGLRLLPRSLQLRLAALGGGGGLLLLVGLAAVHGGAVHRLAATDFASETRAAALGPMTATARAFMPLGAGFGSFDSVYRRFEPDALLSTIYMNQAHDEPMQLAIEGGAPALVLLALFLGWWVWAAVRIVRAPLPPGRRALARASVVLTAILMASSLVDYPLRTPLLGALFAVACLEMLRVLQPPRREPSVSPAVKVTAWS
jgi:hypothetical protein